MIDSTPPDTSLRATFVLAASAVVAVGVACTNSSPEAKPASQPAKAVAPVDVPDGMAVATFAGGCFWCMEAPFDELDGVASTISGYTAGHVDNPTYKQVSAGVTGHTEAVQILFDPSKITYAKLLEVFWHNIDPTVKDRQFCDAGTQYRSGIYFHDDAQKAAAEASRKAIADAKTLPGPIVTELMAASRFYPAEEYHQDFYKKNPGHYQRYRRGCGRDRRLAELWGAAAKPH